MTRRQDIVQDFWRAIGQSPPVSPEYNIAISGSTSPLGEVAAFLRRDETWIRDRRRDVDSRPTKGPRMRPTIVSTLTLAILMALGTGRTLDRRVEIVQRLGGN